MLSQIPLIISPFYHPPKAITLPYNYSSLPKSLPKEAVSNEDIDAWVSEVNYLKKNIIGIEEKREATYKGWEENVARRVAPGYLGHEGSVLTPLKPSTSDSNSNEDQSKNIVTTKNDDQELSEIDKVFGKVVI